MRSKEDDLVDRVKLLVYADEQKKWVLEAYRSLRTNIGYVGSTQASGVFLFTSVAPGEGKSLTVANLAIAMSPPKRILVVDTDFRKPAQHTLFGLKPTVGLTDVLVGGHRWQDVIRAVGVGNVDLMSSGRVPPDPGELLGRQAMREFLKEVRQVYDAILLDSPPLLPYTDACVSAPMVDGVFLVVRSGVTTPDELQQAQTMLAAVNAEITGVVLNGASTAAADPYYYYYDSDDSTSCRTAWSRYRLRRFRRRVVFGLRTI